MKKKQTDDVADFAGAPAPKALGPADVQQKEFRVSRFGGYRMRDVDEFLDQITESMNAMVEENRRLRSRGGGSLIGAPDLADTSRQSDEIIQRARVEAAQIIEAARSGAAGTTAASTPAPGPAVNRAPVGAFLAQERSFLQSLAGLVQEHAETVKGLARADKAAPSTGARGSAAAMPTPGPRSSTAAPSGAERSSTSPEPKTAKTSSTGAESGVRPASDPRPTVPIANVEEPIRLDEPASTSAGARRDDDRPGDAPDRSLRELFWGED
ncbi:MAG: DivIVA protein [Actinomycetota bacterium]|jgi:DivIVA domain-containing protein|nr:DivIVA protein [Actinomycetota bacterium]